MQNLFQFVGWIYWFILGPVLRALTFIRDEVRALFPSGFNKLLNSAFAAFLFLSIGILILVSGFRFLYPSYDAPNAFRQFVSDLYANGGVELIGMGMTVLIIDRLNQRRNTKERKEELILQMGSPDNAIAVEAVRILRLRGWLVDGSLAGANFLKGNLQKARLHNANLKNTNLYQANLQGADLQSANLYCSNLWEANLQWADLANADLTRAGLAKADLRNSHLSNAKLENADLREANLTGAILPDGSMWSETTDLSNFTKLKR